MELKPPASKDWILTTQKHCWIYREANSHVIAREVEKHYLDKGMKGGGGGGSNTSKYVYVYRVTRNTKE